MALALATALLAALLVAPVSANAAPRKPTIASAKLTPLPGQTEAGLAQITVRRNRRASIIAVLIGLTADPNEPTTGTYTLRLSRRTCGSLRDDQSRPRFVGRNLLRTADYTQEGSAMFDDTDVMHLLGRRWRRARSANLLFRNPAGERRIVACGRLAIR